MKLNLNQIIIIILGAALAYFIIFDKDPDPNQELKQENAVLVKEKEMIQNEIDQLVDSLSIFDKRAKYWIERENELNEAISNLDKKNKALQNRLETNKRDRIKAENELEEFKKNPTIMDDSYDLIKDTQKRMGK